MAVPERLIVRPAICLSMIVRNEAHLVREVLDGVAPFITSWVIVDTGSDDGIRTNASGCDPAPVLGRQVGPGQQSAVLDAEPEVFQVGINFADAMNLTGANAAEDAVRRGVSAGRYVLADAVASGPAMFDTARLDRAGGFDGGDGVDGDPIAQLSQRVSEVGLRSASLDEVLCIAAV